MTYNQSNATNLVRATESQCRAIGMRYGSLPNFKPVLPHEFKAVRSNNPDACMNYELVEVITEFMVRWSQADNIQVALTNDLVQRFLKEKVTMKEATGSDELELLIMLTCKERDIDVSETSFSKQGRSSHTALGSQRDLSEVLASFVATAPAE